MPEIVWRTRALADVERLHAFLREKDADAARRAAATILTAVQALKEMPRIGRPMNDGTERRELVIAFGAGHYVLRYRIDRKGAAVILRAWHEREDR